MFVFSELLFVVTFYDRGDVRHAAVRDFNSVFIEDLMKFISRREALIDYFQKLSSNIGTGCTRSHSVFVSFSS